MRRPALAVSIAIAGVGALALPGSALARFHGNLCPVVTAGELSAAHISGSCHKVAPSRSHAHSPLGTETTAQFESFWGPAASSGPTHSLTIHLTKISGSPALLSFLHKRLGKHILESGAPVGIGSVSSWHGQTSSCENPHTGDCTFVTLEAIVKNYVLTVLLSDFPSTGPPETAGEDDPEDLAQEESDRGPAVAIAKSIAKAL
jgi:hypothetical protein